MKITKVNEVYIGVFEVKAGDELTVETILGGVLDGVFRSTIEHNIEAVPNLIQLCNDISISNDLKWRLLKCSNLEEVNIEDFNNINMSNFKNCGGVLWEL